MNQSPFYTDQPILHAGNAIWDDGEWISWDHINQQIEKEEEKARNPRPTDVPIPYLRSRSAARDNVREIKRDNIAVKIETDEEAKLLEGMISLAREYFTTTGRHLPIYGEIGELYAQSRFGIKRHKPHAQGSDGKIGTTFVEVKTITPMKGSDVVQVKRAGNFGVLVVVKIDAEFKCEARVIQRSQLSKGAGKFARVSWNSMTA